MLRVSLASIKLTRSLCVDPFVSCAHMYRGQSQALIMSYALSLLPKLPITDPVKLYRGDGRDVDFFVRFDLSVMLSQTPFRYGIVRVSICALMCVHSYCVYLVL